MNQQFDPDKYHRKSIRLQRYDYRQRGAYFVTICAFNRQCLFGDILNEVLLPNDLGQCVILCWEEIPLHFPHVQLDHFVLMPNHLHGILTIVNDAKVETQEGFGQPTKGSLSTVIRSFKAVVSRKATHHEIPVWQSGYYEHVIRDENDLNRIRAYIVENPLKWEQDRDALVPKW